MSCSYDLQERERATSLERVLKSEQELRQQREQAYAQVVFVVVVFSSRG
jgi:hypothetical protein